LGHECRFFENGKEALDDLRREWADLVILDCGMPVMNGYETCRAIRSIPEAKSLPIIIVSADDSQENILKLLNAGANDYVLKPLREAVLVTKLKNFLKTSSLGGKELEILHGKTVVADRYKIEKVLGYGAHSIVFLAEDVESGGEKVAVKLLNGDAVDDSLAEKILVMASELKNAGPFSHVVRVLDLGRHDNRPFIVLEYADGGDLAARLKSSAPLSEKEAVDIALDCAVGLSELDAVGLTHLDLKPENILLSNGRRKLADFGIQMVEDTTKTIAINSEIWSTAAYSPPEIFLDSDSPSIKSDVYSLGVLLYESLTGDNPFQASKVSASMFRQLNQKPPSLCAVAEKCSIELSRLVDSMLS
jgi:serine/threonine-protein kinase